jgi:ribosomal protein S6
MPVLRLNTTYLTTHPAMQADLESNHELRPNILREYVIFTEYRLQEEKVVGLK